MNRTQGTLPWVPWVPLIDPGFSESFTSKSGLKKHRKMNLMLFSIQYLQINILVTESYLYSDVHETGDFRF
jgi:hypothetical protein